MRYTVLRIQYYFDVFNEGDTDDTDTASDSTIII